MNDVLVTIGKLEIKMNITEEVNVFADDFYITWNINDFKRRKSL